MKRSLTSTLPGKVILLGLFCVAFSMQDAHAFSASISGPDETCPGSTEQYTFSYSYAWYNTNAHTAYLEISGGKLYGTNSSTYWYDIPPVPENFSEDITWDANAGQKFIRMTYYYRSFFWEASKTVTYNVQAGYDKVSSISGPREMCSGTSYTYTVPATGEPVSYLWSVPTGWTVNGQSGTVSTTSTSVSVRPANGANGNYSFNVRKTGSCGSTATTSKSVTVYGTVVPTSNINIWETGGATGFCPGEYYVLAVSAPMATAYQWTVSGPVNVHSSLNGSSLTLYSVTAGLVTIGCRVQNCKGWSDYKYVHYYPTGCYNSYKAGEDVSLQDEEAEKGSSIYPNPARAGELLRLKLPINMAKEDIRALKVTNATGATLLELDAQRAQELSIDLAEFVPGTYRIHLISATGIENIQFVVIE